MNRKNLTAAVLAGLAGAAGIVGSAQAVNINPDGLGQVLIYPYYTVNGGNITLLSVVNTSEDAKAVKVRFMEGMNSREVLDFNLYMSKYDVWTASLKKKADGTPRLKTTDTTCTVPYIYDFNADGIQDPGDGEQEFLPFALDDGGSSDIARTTEGHFEMIEMGTLINESEGSADAATHTPEGMPDDCGQLIDAWTWKDTLDPDTKGYWLEDELYDIEAPSGGMFGGASIVNVQKGTMYSYDAKAINGWNDSVFGGFAPLHTYPGQVNPSLNDGNNYMGYVFMDNGMVAESGSFSRPVDAVSYVFMHDQIMNEYTTETDVAAGTEWVMSFPTKQFYVYGDSAGGYTVPVPPFTNEWDGEGACEIVMLDKVWDREEQTYTETGGEIPPIVSPAPDTDPPELIPFELCYEVSVIEFGPKEEMDYSAILGSSNFHEIDNTLLGFEYGWARVQLADYEYDANEDGVIQPSEQFTRGNLPGDVGGLLGLPVTGFAVMSFENGFLGDGADVLANYGGIFQHKATRKQGFGGQPGSIVD
jgi:hypothetical protein